MKRVYIAFVIIVIFHFYGCKGKIDSQGKHEGIQVVRNGIKRTYKKIDFNVEKTFGSDDQTEVIGYPAMVDADTSGNIYVLDIRRDKVVKLGPDLGYISTIGQRGVGPGEFNFATCMRTGSSNRLYVTDTGRKIEVFNEKGEHEQLIKTGFLIDKFIIDKQTGLITTGYNDYPNAQEKYYRLADFSIMGKSHSDFFSKEKLRFDRFQRNDITAISPLCVYFTGHSGDIYVCCGDKYEILVYGKDRKLKRKITKKHEPILISAKALKLMNDMLAKYQKKRKGFEKKILYQPIMRSISVDEKGQIWIELYKADNIWKRSYETHYDLFSKKGEYLHTVEIMERIMTPLLFQNNHIYCTIENEAGEYLVKKIKIIE